MIKVLQKGKKLGKKLKSTFKFDGPSQRLVLGSVGFIIITHFLASFWIFYSFIATDRLYDD